jgi:hypothetical protein
MNLRYARVAEEAQGRCEYCHAPEDASHVAFQVDHIIPQAKGGPDDAVNLALACHACNSYKSDFQSGFDTESGEGMTLYNPRLQTWDDHFRVDTTTCEIIGLTPTGRATVSRLQMNRPRHIKARKLWIQLDLFP